MPDFDIENKFKGIVAGIDEAGRGPWAGPVVASAVVLPREIPNILLEGLNDSKKLSAKKRELLFEKLYELEDVCIGVGLSNVEEIDDINILQATFNSMKRAIKDLSVKPDVAIIDGNKIPDSFPCDAECVVKGDSKSLSIAAASIIAKVTRDRIMCDIAKDYPYYAWEKNAGYGTKAHQEGLAKYGVTIHHRRTYAPIKKIIEQTSPK